MRLLMEYLDRQLGRHSRRFFPAGDVGGKREGRMGLLLFLFGVVALILAGTLLVTVRF